VSTTFWEDAGPEDTTEALHPDFVVPESSEDYFSHADALLESVIRRCR